MPRLEAQTLRDIGLVQSVIGDKDGALDGDFQEGAGAILANVDFPTLGSACGTVIDVTPATKRVRVSFVNAIGPIPPGTRLVLVPAHVYEVNAQMQLTRDGVLFADDVEDFQVSYFFDVDGNGKVGAPATENPGTAGTAYTAQNRDNSALREIHVDVVTRARDPEAELPASTSIFQATGNRAPIAAVDGFRRRVQQVSARPRNLGSRGS